MLFVAFILFAHFSAYGQVVIEMLKDGGVYKIPCVVNGAKMRLVFDTGAASVCISESIAEYLLENDYLSKDDIVGYGNSTVADGRIVNNIHIILRDIEIGGLHLYNVDAVVIEGQKAPLLLGQTAIQKLGKISIEGNKLVIESVTNEVDHSRIQTLLDKGNDYYSKGNYYAAMTPLAEVQRLVGLNPEGLYMLANCFLNCKEYDRALSIFNEWESLYEENASWLNKHQMYRTASIIYLIQEEYYKSISIAKKDLDNLTILINDKDNLSYACTSAAMEYGIIGDCYSKLEQKSFARENHEMAINLYMKGIGAEPEDVAHGKVHDDTLGAYLYNYAFDHSVYSNEFQDYMCFACQCNYQPAIELLKKNDLYDEFMSRFNRIAGIK